MEYRLSNSNVGGLQAEDFYNYHVAHKKNVLKKFLAWSESQQSNRFLWLAIALFAQIGMTVPATAVCIIFLANNNFLLWIILAAMNIPVLVLNLAALPTRTTLPFVFFGWLTQLLIILYCIGFTLLH